MGVRTWTTGAGLVRVQSRSVVPGSWTASAARAPVAPRVGGWRRRAVEREVDDDSGQRNSRMAYGLADRAHGIPNTRSDLDDQ